MYVGVESSIGSAVLEKLVKRTLEEFSGRTFKKVERLVLRDEKGELYGIPADVEYDLYLENDINYVIEINFHIKPGDVLSFYRTSAFANKCLEEDIRPIILTMSVTETAKKKCEELGIDLISRSVVPT